MFRERKRRREHEMLHTITADPACRFCDPDCVCAFRQYRPHRSLDHEVCRCGRARRDGMAYDYDLRCPLCRYEGRPISSSVPESPLPVLEVGPAAHDSGVLEWTFDAEGAEKLASEYALCERAVELVVDNVQMDRRWVVRDPHASEAVWWHSVLAQHITAETTGDDDGPVVLSVTTPALQLADDRRRGSELEAVEALLGDLNRRGSVNMWRYDYASGRIELTAEAVLAPSTLLLGTQVMAVAALLQSFEAIEALSIVGSAMSDLGIPELSCHPTLGERTLPDPATAMVARELVGSSVAPSLDLAEIALRFRDSCRIAESRTGSLECELRDVDGATLVLKSADAHPVYGPGIEILATVRRDDHRDPSFLAALRNSHERWLGISGAWIAAPPGSMQWRSFWPGALATETTVTWSLQEALERCRADATSVL